MDKPLVLFCDNTGAIANSKEPHSNKRSKNIERKYHIIREYVARGDVKVMKIASEDNLADPFTMTLPKATFDMHIKEMRLVESRH